MRKNRKLVIATALVLASLVICVYAPLIYNIKITWTGVTDKNFEVYDVPSGGSPLGQPWTQTNLIIPTPHIVDFYIENIGNVPITVEVDLINAVGVNCTASWSDGGSYTVPVGETRVHAELTLTLTGAGSYDFNFNSK